MLRTNARTSGSRPTSGRALDFLSPLPWLLLGLLLGCSGGGQTRSGSGSSQIELPDDPEAALARLDQRIAANNKDTEARIRRAEILGGLERHEESAQEWDLALAGRLKGKPLKTARIGSAVAWENACGDLRVLDESERGAIVRAERALAAWRTVANDEDGPKGRLGEIRMLYRLSRFDEGVARLAKIESKSPELSAERCLALIFGEHRGAAPLAVVRGLDPFARSPEESVRELAVIQLIQRAETAADPEVAHTAEGLLVRLSRENGTTCPSLSDWKVSRSRGSDNRLAAAHRQRAIAQTKDALDRGRPLQAWHSLEKLLQGENEGTPQLRALVNQCCQQLCGLCQEKLAIGDVDAAGETATVIRALPNAWLAPAEKECASTALHSHQVAAIRVQAESTLTEARKAVDERRPDDALTTLDPLLDKFPPELVPEVQMIRARALALKEQPAEALALLERYGPFSDPVVQRLHGTLLASADRGEEAEAFLENLPLKFFNVEAFDGLLLALEQQNKWEKLIARLNTLGGELPLRYRPIRLRAVVGAAQRRIDNLDPQGAIDMLRGNLDPDELLKGGSGPLLVQAMLESGQTDRALEILIDEGGGIDSVPANLVTMVADKAADRLDPEQRFQLLRRVPEWERNKSTKEFLAESWPKYGDYLPRPGRYSATYEVKAYGAEGQITRETIESVQIVWKGTYFAVHGDERSKETWRPKGDLWIRTTDEYEWWIPIHTDGRPPLPPVESPDGVSCKLVEAGHSVTAGSQTYRGCVGIEATLPNLGPDESIRIDVAPEVGEVRWQRRVGRLKVEERLLIGIIKMDEN